MDKQRVRLTGIVIRNLKNVGCGELNFINTRKPYNASVLALYGQNGSGKTALIDALQILKYALSGEPVPDVIADYISIDAEAAALSFRFEVTAAAGKYDAFYEFRIRKESTPAETENGTARSRVVLFDEVLSYSYDGTDAKIRKGPLINTCSSDVFTPAEKYRVLIGRGKKMDLRVERRRAAETSRSFIFSRTLLYTADQHGRELEPDSADLQDYNRHMTLLTELSRYGIFDLFVISTMATGLISFNALPLPYKYQGKGKQSVGEIMLSLEGPYVVSSEMLALTRKVIGSMNIVLTQIVPGLEIAVKELGAELLNNAKEGCRIELVSCKNGREIPLRNESEGIKKIVSVLQLLIAVYNQPSVTVAIDELDSGIFEYLLGELMSIISERGKGQLIFTSHNLRPLETLDRGFVAFTTTSPEKRYVRLTGIKDSNNLRDYYYRDIMLGEQDEELYAPTSNAEIAFAFREAGEYNGS